MATYELLKLCPWDMERSTGAQVRNWNSPNIGILQFTNLVERFGGLTSAQVFLGCLGLSMGVARGVILDTHFAVLDDAGLDSEISSMIISLACLQFDSYSTLHFSCSSNGLSYSGTPSIIISLATRNNDDYPQNSTATDSCRPSSIHKQKPVSRKWNLTFFGYSDAFSAHVHVKIWTTTNLILSKHGCRMQGVRTCQNFVAKVTRLQESFAAPFRPKLFVLRRAQRSSPRVYFSFVIPKIWAVGHSSFQFYCKLFYYTVR